LLYDAESRKSFFSLASAYKDILVYLIFFSIIIIGWALVGSRGLTFNTNFLDANFPQQVDPYKTNYSDLGKMIFIVYVSATYDSYPDNELLAVQNSQVNYIYFIIFIFLNMFLFSSIPGSIVYNKFRGTRSKIILVD
jgi:cytochrome b561